MHANFICPTHNLMVLLGEEIENDGGISNRPERKRQSEREKQAKESGAGYGATMMQRFTLRGVKFVRWLRNFLYRETGWGDALACLAMIYAARRSKFSTPLVRGDTVIADSIVASLRRSEPSRTPC